MKVKVFPIQIQTGKPFSVYKVAHSQPCCIKLHETSFLTGEVKKKKHTIFWKKKEQFVWEGQKVGCVTIYHECQLSTELLPPT